MDSVLLFSQWFSEIRITECYKGMKRILLGSYLFSFFQIVLACVAAMAVAAPQQYYEAPSARSFDNSLEVAAILRDERQMADDASRYNFVIETEDGIKREEFGAAIEDGSAEGAVAQSGKIS